LYHAKLSGVKFVVASCIGVAALEFSIVIVVLVALGVNLLVAGLSIQRRSTGLATSLLLTKLISELEIGV
jgi:hypothetical protein